MDAPRRRLRADARRAVLLEAGRRVFAERGYRDTSLDDVAAVAGVTKPVVYQHFSSKEEFYASIAREEMDEMVRRLSPTITSGSPRKLIEAAARAWLRYVEERPDGFAAVASHAPVGWQATAYCGDLRSALYEAIEGNVAKHLRAAGLDDRHAGLLTYAIVGMWFFVGQWWAYTKAVPTEEAATVMASLMWKGIEGLPEIATAPPTDSD